MTYQVLVTDFAWPNLEIECEVLKAAGAELIAARVGSEEELLSLAPEVDAIMTCWKNVTAPVLEAATKCRHVARYGVGLDNIDLQAATRLGILVTNVPNYCADEVQEHAMALIFACGRHIVQFSRATHVGEWDLKREKPIHRLRSSTLGIVGFGTIGRGLADRARGFGMSILAFDAHTGNVNSPDAECARSIEDVFRRSDFVSLHVPLTSSTQGLVGRELLALMKPTAFLINTSRGPVIDEEALCEALQTRRIAGAALDVLCEEPPRSDHPLLTLDNVIATPHAAFYSEESLADLQRITASQVVEVLSGRTPLNVVNPSVFESSSYRAGVKP